MKRREFVAASAAGVATLFAGPVQSAHIPTFVVQTLNRDILCHIPAKDLCQAVRIARDTYPNRGLCVALSESPRIVVELKATATCNDKQMNELYELIREAEVFQLNARPSDF